MHLTVSCLGWVLLDVTLTRAASPVEGERVGDLGADRTVAVPDDLLGIDGIGFYRQARA